MAPLITHSAAIMAILSSALLVSADDSFCTFYTESYCEERSGSVNYSVNNDGIFQNGGPYFKCATTEEISLISYPAGDSNGDSPKHCNVFTAGGPGQVGTGSDCTHLDSIGFTTGDGGYYRISLDKVCPATSEKREAEAEPEAEPEAKPAPVEEKKVAVPFGRNSSSTEADIRRRNELRDVLRRDGNYFTFYDDPDCRQQSGSVSYSIKNDGCFENGGAYGAFGGDSDDWHIEQYQSVDADQCTGDLWHCVTAAPFYSDQGLDCVHLDDVGLQSGFGSYRIAKAGCPGPSDK